MALDIATRRAQLRACAETVKLVVDQIMARFPVPPAAKREGMRAEGPYFSPAGWHSCDHLGPVHEGDTLHSSVEIESAQPLGAGGLVGLRSRVYSAPGNQVLDWRFVAILAQGASIRNGLAPRVLVGRGRRSEPPLLSHGPGGGL